MTAPRTSLTRRLWRIIPGPSPGPRTRRAPGPCPSSPPACPGRRMSLRLTTDPTAVPLTGHGPTPLTAETRPGATGTRSCLLPLLPSLKSPPCVSSFYNSHPVALIHYLVGFSILSCGLEQVNSLGDKCSVLSSAESLTRYFHFSVVIHRVTEQSGLMSDSLVMFASQCPHCYSILQFSVSGSNLATHIVGSLKKGKSLTPIPPTTYNTLPSSHALSQHRNISDGMISPSPNLSLPPSHKRSPSSDSGNPGSRSTTPVSYHLGKIHGRSRLMILSFVFLFFPLRAEYCGKFEC